jgi:hypothetical protein
VLPSNPPGLDPVGTLRRPRMEYVPPATLPFYGKRPRRVVAMALFLAVALATTAGCGVRRNLKPGVKAAPRPDAAIVVFGVKQGHGIVLERGTLEDGVWDLDLFGGLFARAFPDKEGFLVLQLAPQVERKAYGVTSVIIDDVGSPPRDFRPCGGGTITFQAEAGKVTYVGDLETERSNDRSRIAPSLTANEEEARAYIGRYYPGLLGSFVRRDAVFRRARGVLCRPNIPLVIFVPI